MWKIQYSPFGKGRPNDWWHGPMTDWFWRGCRGVEHARTMQMLYWLFTNLQLQFYWEKAEAQICSDMLAFSGPSMFRNSHSGYKQLYVMLGFLFVGRVSFECALSEHLLVWIWFLLDSYWFHLYFYWFHLDSYWFLLDSYWFHLDSSLIWLWFFSPLRMQPCRKGEKSSSRREMQPEQNER